MYLTPLPVKFVINKLPVIVAEPLNGNPVPDKLNDAVVA
jgi:hypothetical protein